MLESNKKRTRLLASSPPCFFFQHYSFITFVNVFFFSFLDTLYSNLPYTVTFLEFLPLRKEKLR